MTAPSEQRGGRVVSAMERREALRLARSIIEWTPRGIGHPLMKSEKVARALLAAEQEIAALRVGIRERDESDDYRVIRLTLLLAEHGITVPAFGATSAQSEASDEGNESAAGTGNTASRDASEAGSREEERRDG